MNKDSTLNLILRIAFVAFFAVVIQDAAISQISIFGVTADVTPLQVASMHAGGTSAVFSSDRGHSVTAMAEAFARWVAREPRIGGIISAGGSGGTTLATAGMRALPLAVPAFLLLYSVS